MAKIIRELGYEATVAIEPAASLITKKAEATKDRKLCLIQVVARSRCDEAAPLVRPHAVER